MGHRVKTKTLSYLSVLPDAIVHFLGERMLGKVFEPINPLLDVSCSRLSTPLSDTLKLGIYLVTRLPLRTVELVFPLLLHITCTAQF